MTMLKPCLLLAGALLFLAGCARPVARFATTATDDRRAPAQISFQNASENAEEYVWDFGDGNTATQPTPNHTFREAGNYLVMLEAKKGDKVSRSYQRISVEGPSACLVELSTDYGTMIIKLHDATPLHRDNFMALVRQGFYDELLFHRVIKGFMIQGGDPQSRGATPDDRLGSGGPGYTIPAEIVDTLVHIKGALAAARTGDQVNPEKRSSGSQFYIVDGRQVTESALQQGEARNDFRYAEKNKDVYLQMGGTPFLDQNYTVFGQVISGLEVIDRIAAVQTAPGDRPRQDVRMNMRILNYFPDKAARLQEP